MKHCSFALSEPSLWASRDNLGMLHVHLRRHVPCLSLRPLCNRKGNMNSPRAWGPCTVSGPSTPSVVLSDSAARRCRTRISRTTLATPLLSCTASPLRRASSFAVRVPHPSPTLMPVPGALFLLQSLRIHIRLSRTLLFAASSLSDSLVKASHVPAQIPSILAFYRTSTLLTHREAAGKLQYQASMRRGWEENELGVRVPARWYDIV